MSTSSTDPARDSRASADVGTLRRPGADPDLVRTKIVATLGPASSSEQAIGALIQAGVDVFRLNFSHADRERHAGTIEAIRAASVSPKACWVLVRAGTRTSTSAIETAKELGYVTTIYGRRRQIRALINDGPQ